MDTREKVLLPNHANWMYGLLWVVGGAVIGSLLSMGVVFAAELVMPDLSQRMHTKLGLRKPEILGFQPYWLLDDASREYRPYLTEVVYFGLVLTADGTIQRKVNPKEQEPGWTHFMSSKLRSTLASYSATGTSVSLLVHLSDEAVILDLLKNPEQHAHTFMDQVLPLLDQHGYTDLNLDIESFRDATVSEQQAFTLFLQTVRTRLNKEEKKRSLTIEISPSSGVNQQIFDVPAVGQIADRIVLMAYDYHYRGSFISGPVAPVGGAPDVREHDVESSLQRLLAVVPAEKILLGIPAYGYEWETLQRNPGAPVIPRTGKTASHRRVEELLATCVHCTKDMDDVAGQSYLILPQTEEGYSQQIFYEDRESLQKKIDLAIKYRLRGVALWALGYEGSQFLQPLEEYRQSWL